LLEDLTFKPNSLYKKKKPLSVNITRTKVSRYFKSRPTLKLGTTLLLYHFFTKNQGPLSYEPRGNLSVFTRLIIYAISCYIKNILDLERLFPRWICPFCPVIFGSKLRNRLKDKRIQNVHPWETDIFILKNNLSWKLLHAVSLAYLNICFSFNFFTIIDVFGNINIIIVSLFF
jgi:hypothetical protein